MANVPETPSFDAGIYQIETTDPVLGGVNGIANAQAKGLANRTAFLKQQIDQLNSGQLKPGWIASTDYVQGELQKLDAKQSVRAATVANITLSGAQTIDGVTLTVGDRVLVKDQTTAAQNGIYLVAAQSWTRATDADNGTKLSSGARVAVEDGTVNAGKVWYLATTGIISLGTTSLLFKSAEPDTTGRLLGVKTFTSSGVYTPAEGVKSVVVEMVGGGGGSGGTTSTSAGQASLGGGGGAGAYAKAILTAAEIGSSQSVTIGAGGSPGPATTGDAGSGGTTSLGALVSAPGGGGGGAGSVSSGPVFMGNSGRPSSSPSGSNITGYAGSQGGTGCLLSSTSGLSGSGANSHFGTGGDSKYASSGGQGNSGNGYGSGAGGSANTASQAAKTGTAGQPGIMIIWEYS
ncbi:glycine-rich domain-containing protein [Aeromonas veronii]|uniref:glycine-rich domain-containing protein n=1 Tax=Aeromonas veronii TaxID=654 RepID=UPI003D21A778